MGLTHTCTGFQSPCRLLVLVLVVFLCYLPTGAFPEDQSPKIISKRFAWRGNGGVISCQADPGFPDDFTLIYWLVNRTFIEKAYPDGRVHESEETAVEASGRALIQRDLIFRNVSAEDYRSSYTCVVNSPAGIDRFTFPIPRRNAEDQSPKIIPKKFVWRVSEKHRNERSPGKGKGRRRPRKTKPSKSKKPRSSLKKSSSNLY